MSQPLFHKLNGVIEVASSEISENHKNLKSNFRDSLLISWSLPLLWQPLFVYGIEWANLLAAAAAIAPIKSSKNVWIWPLSWSFNLAKIPGFTLSM